MPRLVLPAVTLLFATYPRDAWAYLDPGTGSVILQVAIASVFSSLFALTLHWRRLKARLSMRPVEGDESHSDPPEDDPG